jgi:hypothetical protein
MRGRVQRGQGTGELVGEARDVLRAACRQQVGQPPEITESWELKEGTVLTMLVAMSVLALLGLRYPQRMLPILLFEAGWKLTWLGVVALPLWLDGDLTGATREQAAAVLWVTIVIAVIPWRHVVSQLVMARGDRWR